MPIKLNFLKPNCWETKVRTYHIDCEILHNKMIAYIKTIFEIQFNTSFI